MKSIEEIKKLSNRHIKLEYLTKQLKKDLETINGYWPREKQQEKVTASFKIKTFLTWDRMVEVDLTADEVKDILTETYLFKIAKHESEMEEIKNKLGVVTMTKDDLDF